MKKGFVYVLASQKNGTLYVGVTSNLVQRIKVHHENSLPGFTARYAVKRLVYYEIYPTLIEAIEREKALKKWRRQWKIALIESVNPEWQDLTLHWDISHDFST